MIASNASNKLSKRKVTKIIIIASLILSLTLFGIIFLFWDSGIIDIEYFNKEFFNLFPAIIGTIVGLLLIVGSIYLIKKKGKIEYKTFPIYGLSIITEGIGASLEGVYEISLEVLGFFLLLTAITIDIKQKIGLYQFFKKVWVK